ncbi:MAG: hypothetical protein ACOZF0_23705 [Thermodesulfobacteriota bacterium]
MAAMGRLYFITVCSRYRDKYQIGEASAIQSVAGMLKKVLTARVLEG